MICAIILASGNSTRFNSEIPKQFHKLNGHMLLDYPIQTFSECGEIDRLIIVVPENYCAEIQKEYPDHSVVSGGSSRKESAFQGLLACPPETEKVLIHDAARALVDTATIIRCINGLDEAKAISTVIPAKDTVVETNENIIVKMPNRSRMYLEQTPQGFHYQTILKAHTNFQVDTTDDIRLVNEMGIKCATVEGSENNFKITTKQDYLLAEILLREEG
ncbi:2-C-methyl-D-erythritol 4-phosphate cytidylyltransferase [Marine Group I thaumarchaeote]|uniref:2-C-methyl-D-erythritol 4-phosphate cytidylyltransferase n=1 Tax=Marine Group I thaumarchaeote TaxID=2511932 RepID=A0A7K4MQI8_9ARCH|nr:2-C-methyl-D-erythritol 4-phosphate cytidylyltransferase [Marine Group I thaumarchaeote]